MIGGVMTAAAHPAHVVAQQLASGVAEFADFEIFHSESFDDAISSGGFLQNLAEVGKASLAVFRGTPNFAAKFSNRDDDKREEHNGGQGHFPVQPKEDTDENDEAESLLKKVGQVFGERDTSAFHVVDSGGEKATDRIVLKEGDGLADDFCVDLIAKIGDCGLSDVLNLRDAQILGDGLCQVQTDQAGTKESRDVVKA